MSTIAEIEAAIERLPPEQWLEIRRWLDTQMSKVAESRWVEWASSQAVTRERLPETLIKAEVVMAALAAVRE